MGVARLWVLKLPRLWLNLGFPTPPSKASLLLGLFDLVALVGGGSLGVVRMFRTGERPTRAAIIMLFGYIVALTALHVATFAVVGYAFSGLVLVFMFVPEGAMSILRRRS